MDKFCRECGHTVPRERQIYCSLVCGRRSAYRMAHPGLQPVDRSPLGPCLGCGGPLKEPSRRGRRRLVCSGSCQARVTRSRRGLFVSQIRACAVCDQEFLARRATSSVCSVRCRTKSESVAHGPLPPKTCPECGESFVTIYPVQRFCDRACSRRFRERPDNAPAGYNERRSHQLSRGRRRAIFERDGWRCYLCSKAIDRSLVWPHPLSGSLDHVKPVAMGGEHDPGNLRATHFACNLEKGDEPAPWWVEVA